MPLLEWTKEYSVGVESLDDEHKMLFRIINELDENINAGEGYKSLSFIFTQMKAYSLYHFSSEEKILFQASYPEMEAQRKEHAAFIERINEMEKELAQMRMGVEKEVMTFLKGWWTGHIQNSDKKYGGYLNGKGYR